MWEGEDEGGGYEEVRIKLMNFVFPKCADMSSGFRDPHRQIEIRSLHSVYYTSILPKNMLKMLSAVYQPGKRLKERKCQPSFDPLI